MMVASNLISARQLDSRVSDRLQVRLLWCPVAERARVAVTDPRDGDQFSVEVCERALDHGKREAASVSA